MNFNFDNPYLSTRAPLFARNVVSTSHPLAAQAGLQMLRQGGNAVDAAVAAAAAMTIVEPVSNGLGSDAFALVWDGQALQGLNASGRAPQAWTPDYFTRKYGAGAPNPPKRGLDAVTVPGAGSAWAALSERGGTLPFDELLAPLDAGVIVGTLEALQILRCLSPALVWCICLRNVLCRRNYDTQAH